MSNSLTKLDQYNNFNLDLFLKDLNYDQQDNYFYLYNNFLNNRFKFASL